MLKPHHKAVPQEPRLYHLVAQRIREVVRRDAIAPGARLPSERELSARLNVSRPSLRAAMIALELGGEVEVRGGSGVYLARGNGHEHRLPETRSVPLEVLAARRVIEPELAAIAARVATDGAIDAIMAAARELEREPVDTQDSERADRLFHRSIALATGNGAMVGLLDCLWEQHYQTEELRNMTVADHRAIVHAITMRDPASARRAMRAHLSRPVRGASRLDCGKRFMPFPACASNPAV